MRCLLLMVLCLLGSALCDPVVRVEQGQIRGITRRDRNNGNFFSFRNIPYARPPVENLRFRDPLPPTNWLNIRDSSRDLPFCVQFSLQPPHDVFGEEDCLYLNVHTRQVPTQANPGNDRPVMVWFHGGFFTVGSGSEDLHNPEFLMTENVVLVTVNYRLNIFGFFSIEDNNLGVPGNAGLKDQLKALEWIRDNIAQFGGNPNSVTIFGQGSGAVSVHYHMLSPLSRGLFHRAIMQSGTAISPWMVGLRNNGLGLAHELNINTTSRVRMLETLQWLLPKQIVEGYRRLSTSSSMNWGSVINPVVERQTDGTAFLTGDPLDLITRGQFADVPLMIGYTDSEGIAIDQIKMILLNRNHSMVIHDFAQMIPVDLQVRPRTDLEVSISNQIQNFYFGDRPSDQPNKTAIVRMFTDVWFAFPAFRTANIQIRTTNASLFFYKFSADTTLNVFKRRHPISALIPGASHEDDIGYLFRTALTPEVPPGSIEDFAINRIVHLWVSFASGGAVVGDNTLGFTWNSISPATPQMGVVFNFADLGTLVSTMGRNPDEASMSFWTGIYDRRFSNASLAKGLMGLIIALGFFGRLF